MFSKKFVSATLDKASWGRAVPAPYLRRDICLNTAPQKAELTVCGLGFYRVFVNGTEVTKGFLSSYIANPDHLHTF